MAFACDACGEPVHEQAVKCPHCGDYSGAPIDPMAVAEASATRTAPIAAIDPMLVAGSRAAAVVEVVSNVLEKLVGPTADDPLPRATVRPKR